MDYNIIEHRPVAAIFKITSDSSGINFMVTLGNNFDPKETFLNSIPDPNMGGDCIIVTDPKETFLNSIPDSNMGGGCIMTADLEDPSSFTNNILRFGFSEKQATAIANAIRDASSVIQNATAELEASNHKRKNHPTHEVDGIDRILMDLIPAQIRKHFGHRRRK